jgi:predicted dehydrogenase
MSLRIGILGAAGIAPTAIIDPARRRDDVTIAAVAARTSGRAAPYAERHGIPRSYDGYEALLEDPEIDLVYVALAPSDHARWTIAALRAGKDVLCEKPFTMDAAEAREVNAVAAETGRRAIEAFHDHYHPLRARTQELAAAVGPIVRVESDFLVTNSYAADTIRHEPRLGGGALMDLGCYAVHHVRELVGEEPEVRSATWTANPSGADMSIDAELLFPSGVTGRVRADMDHEFVDETRITGKRGEVLVVGPVFPSHGHRIRWTRDGITRNETVAGAETYDHQLAAVVAALAAGTPLPTEGEDPVANMAVIDAIYAAAGVARPPRS